MKVGGKKLVHAECGDDQLELKKNPEIQLLVELYGLDPTDLTFEGCRNGSFSTTQIGSTYTIRYPIDQDISYVAPLAHELAHVWQGRKVGSLKELFYKFPNGVKEIELGADFLTGIVFEESNGKFPKNLFQTNFSLSGLYFEQNEDAHGTPSQRAAAFRLGYFYTPKFDNLGEAMETFHADVYGSLHK